MMQLSPDVPQSSIDFCSFPGAVFSVAANQKCIQPIEMCLEQIFDFVLLLLQLPMVVLVSPN